MPKQKKTAPKKRGPKPKTTQPTDHTGTFEIEATPPPLIRGITAEKQRLYDRLDATVTNTAIGQAFIIPALNRNSVESCLKRTYTGDRWAFAKVAGNDAVLRVYRLEQLKPTKK